MNGQLSGIGADATQNAVVVEAVQPMGLLITNGQFVAPWRQPDRTRNPSHLHRFSKVEQLRILGLGYSECGFPQPGFRVRYRTAI